MEHIDPLSLMIIGIIISGIGIALLWSRPRRWKIVGTICAVIGAIINVANLLLHVNSLQIPMS